MQGAVERCSERILLKLTTTKKSHRRCFNAESERKRDSNSRGYAPRPDLARSCSILRRKSHPEGFNLKLSGKRDSKNSTTDWQGSCSTN